MTPQMTNHARERCAEMKISTKVAKRIVRLADTCYPGHFTSKGELAWMCQYNGEPRYTVVTSEKKDWVLTVLFRTEASYTRNGDTFIPIERSIHGDSG